MQSILNFQRLLLLWMTLIACIGHFCTAGQLSILHSPYYLQFRNAGPLSPSQVPGLVSSLLGFSVQKGQTWNGMLQSSLFDRPRAVVLVSVEGVEKPSEVSIGHYNYKITDEEGTIDTTSVTDRLREVAPKPLIVDFSSDNSILDVLASHQLDDVSSSLEQVRNLYSEGRGLLQPLLSLNISNQADLLFVAELQLVLEITRALAKMGVRTTPDFFHFRLGGLKKLTSVYGESSQQVADAWTLLKDTLNKITEDLKTLYKNNVLMQFMSLSPVSERQMRKGRSLLADDPTQVPPLENRLGLSLDYGDSFPVLFNMMFWTFVFLVVLVGSISACIWHMDPGRDSIIYRMTSQRMKKD